jgi:hypothetical protein
VIGDNQPITDAKMPDDLGVKIPSHPHAPAISPNGSAPVLRAPA